MPQGESFLEHCFTCIWIGLTIFTIDIIKRLKK